MQNSPNKDFMPKREIKPEALAWLDGIRHLPASLKWIEAMRSTGVDAFSVAGIPDQKHEDWKYTNLRDLKYKSFQYSNVEINTSVPEKLIANSKRIVFINGKYSDALSDNIIGVQVESLKSEKIKGVDAYLATVGTLENEPFKALNAAYMNDGVVLKVRSGENIAEPIEILFYNMGDDTAIYPRNLYWLEKGASAVIVENYAGEGEYFFNSYTGIVQEENSSLKFYRIQDESRSAYHFTSTVVQQHRNSVFENLNFIEGAKLSRTEIRNDLVGANADNSANGLYLLRDVQVADFKVLTQHLEPHCPSHQYFKGAVDDDASVALQGKIYVARGAQKTDGYQMHKSILLSDRARAQYKPELEIYADDVKCSHGATSGQLDVNALFYMQSRGIAEYEARKMLTQAFLNEMLEKISFEPVRQICAEKIEKWLNR